MYLITEFKRCCTCREILPASEFYFSPARLGLCNRCKACSKASALKHYYENTEKCHAQSKQWVEKNPERRKELANKFAKKNYAARREELLADRKAWNKNNRPSVNARKRERYKTDPAYKLLANLRSRIPKALKAIRKSARTVELLGCQISELRLHLEKQFRPGMTWENYGPVWHVDHKRPCASFDLMDSEQQKQCFHYTNLQPLFASDNIKKGDSYVSVV